MRWRKMKINWKKMKKENGFQRFLSETDLLYNNRSFQRDNIQLYFLGFKVKRTTTLQLWPSYSNSIIAAIPSFLEEKNSSSSVFFTGENPKDQLDSIRHFEEFCRSHLKCNINEKRPLPQYITHLLRVRVCVTFSQKSGTKIRKNSKNYRFLTFSMNKNYSKNRFLRCFFV